MGVWRNMIIRPSEKLARKLGEVPQRVVTPAANPFADWTARLFTVSRAQYIMLTNSRSLYTVVIHGAGVTDLSRFVTRAFGQLRDAMEEDAMGFLYHRLVSPALSSIVFAKSLSRSVTGSMNDLVNSAKCILLNPDLSPWDASHQLNRTPMGSLGYAFPVEAFRDMRIQEKE